MIAKKLNPSYLEKPYWWSEVGGVLFISLHEKFAEKFYRKSIEIDVRKINSPLNYA